MHMTGKTPDKSDFTIKSSAECTSCKNFFWSDGQTLSKQVTLKVACEQNNVHIMSSKNNTGD